MKRLKYLLSLSLLFTFFHSLSAQNTVIKGTVLESNSKQAIEFATILIADKTSKAALSGTTSAHDGQFEVAVASSNFYIEVSFIGFNTQTFEDFEIEDNVVNLGVIELDSGHALDEVLVRAEKSQTEFKLDKRVFNVGKDLSSTGASALELLNNVPSVEVNIEGQVSLRGSQGVQMLINGKPSVLASEEGNALGSITAEMIEKIEVITNPSAKYDAEGTAGIINIVLKKDEKKGLNGSITVNTGVPNNHSLGLSLNKRTEKFNLFSQLGIGRRTFPQDRTTSSIDLVNNVSIASEGESEKNETFYNLILGTDYHINKLNVLTLTGRFAFEQEDENADLNFEQIDASNEPTDGWRRSELTEATNPKWEYELQYKKDFKRHKDQSLLFSAMGDFFGKDKTSEFDNIIVLGNETNTQQKTRTDFAEARYTFKLDYTHPFSDKVSLETGAQYVSNDVSNDYAVSDLINDEWINNPNLTNIFEFDQKVLGLYSSVAYEHDKWGLKLGLRLENTDLNTLLKNTDERNQRQYTDLFPSAHTSYKLSDNFSLQAAYSRRIFRPRLWDLNPFFNIRNNFNIYTGNPNLDAEYSDAYEINAIYIIGQTSINFGVYHRYTTDVIEDVSSFENNITTRMPSNIGTNAATGVEFNAKYSPKRWLSFNADFNYNYFNRKGEYESQSFDFDADRWSSRLTAKLKLPAQMDLELSANYRSKYQTFQQEIADNFFTNLGVRKKMLKKRLIVNLSVRDVFASRVREQITSQPTFYLKDKSQRGRFVILGLSYGFGKGEAMEFSGHKRF